MLRSARLRHPVVCSWGSWGRLVRDGSQIRRGILYLPKLASHSQFNRPPTGPSGKLLRRAISCCSGAKEGASGERAVEAPREKPKDTLGCEAHPNLRNIPDDQIRSVARRTPIRETSRTIRSPDSTSRMTLRAKVASPKMGSLTACRWP